jgi:hypothetical protein
MVALVIWMLAFTISICLSVVGVALDMSYLQMGATALVTLAIAIVAVQTHRGLSANGASRSALAANTARHIGLVWGWAAAAILIIYSFLLVWREAWVFTIGLSLVSAMCLGLSQIFERDAAAGREDATMLSLGRALNALQIVGMILAMVGLIADRKFGLVPDVSRADWAANNIFFFGALAVAAIGFHSWSADRKLAEQARS